ncbi:BTB/POZ domain-containing protein 2 [Exaiptasia diaphana]|nr:BTB/POZ domain-containing protein 2 [Exaiptasia diaphana]
MEHSNWQTDCSTLKQRSKYAFDNSMFCDVEFSVVDNGGNKVQVPANKYVLSLTSPFFAAMFYGQLAVNKPVIDLPECTKDGLNQMMCFAHTDEVNLTEENVMEVLYLADKFIIPSLVEKCRKYLKKLDLKPEDVLNVLPLIQKIGDKNLQEYFWSIVEVKSSQIISSNGFLDISRELLCQILQREILDIKEIEIFQAVDKWATKRIEEKGLVHSGKVKRAILGLDVIRQIRFPLMTHKDFAEIVLPCKILINTELIELFQIFHKVSPETKTFITKQRCMGDLLIPNLRFNHVEDGDFTSNIVRSLGLFTDALHFTINKSLYLVGVVCFGKQGTEYDVGLTVYKNNQIAHEVYSQGKQGNEVVMSSDGFIITYKDSKQSTSTNVSQGQFPTLLFRKL